MFCGPGGDRFVYELRRRFNPTLAGLWVKKSNIFRERTRKQLVVLHHDPNLVTVVFETQLLKQQPAHQHFTFIRL